MSLYGVPLPLPSIKELLQDGAASIKQEFPPRPAVQYSEESNQQVQLKQIRKTQIGGAASA